MNIVLIGLMGSGKSAVGRLLAERLGRPFIDTDAAIEAETGQTIPEIFAAEGEEGFRDREARVIARLAAGDGQVIATGGGAPLRPENREALRQNSLVIWLNAAPEVLYQRAAAQGLERRPLLTCADPLGRLRALAESRAEAYQAAAHRRIDTAGRPVEAVVNEVLAMLKKGVDRLG